MAAGWTGLNANAINDKGQITGYGAINDNLQEFLLSDIATPIPTIPEPETYAIMLTGLKLLGFSSLQKSKQNTLLLRGMAWLDLVTFPTNPKSFPA